MAGYGSGIESSRAQQGALTLSELLHLDAWWEISQAAERNIDISGVYGASVDLVKDILKSNNLFITVLYRSYFINPQTLSVPKQTEPISLSCPSSPCHHTQSQDRPPKACRFPISNKSKRKSQCPSHSLQVLVHITRHEKPCHAYHRHRSQCACRQAPSSHQRTSLRSERHGS